MDGRYDDDAIPAGCDGCGRDAAAAGMDSTGWTVRRDPLTWAGVYCPACAATLRLLGTAIECTDCGRAVTERKAEAAGWRFYPDGLGELQPYCPGCRAATG